MANLGSALRHMRDCHNRGREPAAARVRGDKRRVGCGAGSRPASLHYRPNSSSILRAR